MRPLKTPFLNEEQQLAKKEIAAFSAAELNRGRSGHGTELFSMDDWRKCASIGLQSLVVPEEFGGRGGGPLLLAAALNGLGYGCRNNGLTFALVAHTCAVEIPIIKFGSPAQKQRYLPPLGRGETVGAHAISEAEAGSDAFNLKTRARKQGTIYVVDGSKSFVSNAPVADLFVVYAMIDTPAGPGPATAFLVEKDTPGLRVEQPIDKMGLRTCPISNVVLESCEVAEEQILGGEGRGQAVFMKAMEWERGCGVAWLPGVMERQLEACIGYVNDRKQFGQPIGRFSAVSNRVAEMRVRLEAAQLMVYQTAWRMEHNDRVSLEAAMTKLFVTEAALETQLDALRIHGAYGYTTASGIEEDVRDALASPLYSGTSDIQRLIIARLLGL